MKKADRTIRSRFVHMVEALLLNSAFLIITMLLIAPGFESNDDRAISAFIDGQMAAKCTYIPYINYLLALLLRSIYVSLGDGAAWYTLFQLGLLLLGFTAISYCLFRRLNGTMGTLVSLCILLFVGVDAYTVISYTKTAAVCTVGGMMLLFNASDRERGLKWVIAFVIGAALCLMGFMLRYMEFLPCMGIMAALGLYALPEIFSGDKSLGRKFLALGRYILPFAIMLGLCAGAFVIDRKAWQEEPYSTYYELDQARIALTDYGIPPYNAMKDTYDSLGLSENAMELFCGGNFFDGVNFSKDNILAITDARDSIFSHPGIGECLGIFLDNCLMGFFAHLPVFAVLAAGILWLAGGDHRFRGWLSVAAALGIFCAMYLYLIWRGRYLIDRVDMGLMLAVSGVLAWTLKRERLAKEKMICSVVLALCVAVFAWTYRSSLRWSEGGAEDTQSSRQAIEALTADEDHLYLAKLDTVSEVAYSPLEPYPLGYLDRVVLLGGWYYGHPAIMDILAKNDITVPFRDIVNNDNVYIIEDDVDSTVSYIREYYDKNARAEKVGPISRKTGLEIYRIVS